MCLSLFKCNNFALEIGTGVTSPARPHHTDNACHWFSHSLHGTLTSTTVIWIWSDLRCNLKGCSILKQYGYYYSGSWYRLKMRILLVNTVEYSWMDRSTFDDSLSDKLLILTHYSSSHFWCCSWILHHCCWYSV